MLDELCALSGYNRSYAARLLREKARGRPSRRKRRRGRGPVYGPELLAPLTKVWATLGGICGKRLAAVMGRTVAALERHGELALTDEAREKLLTMSAATIDRLLAAKRRRLRLKGMSHTKPGSLLKSQIPVRTFAEWDQGRPGFVEIDLVGHEGGEARGEFAYSLCVTDVASAWTEVRIVRNRARRWTFEALLAAPTQQVGVDELAAVVGVDAEQREGQAAVHVEQRLTFTRSRAYEKN